MSRMVKVGLLILGLTALIGFYQPGAVQAADKISLRLGTLCAVDSPCVNCAEKIAELVKAKSNGRLVIDIFPAGQLGSAPSMIDSLKIGALDVMWGGIGWLPIIEKNYLVLSLPFLFNTQEDFHKWLDSDDHAKLKDLLVKKHSLRLINYKADKLGRVIVSKKPIFTPEDMKGLKMRVPEVPAYKKMASSLGAIGTTLAWGETYMGLRQGVVEACEGAFDIVIPHKMHEAAPYITFTEHIRAVWMFLMSDKAYQALPDDLKQSLEAAVDEAADWYNSVVMPPIKEKFTQKLLADKGFLIYASTKPFRAKTEPMYKELAPSKEIEDMIERAKAMSQ